MIETNRRYVIPYNADEEVPADFLEAFGIKSDAAAPPAEGDPPKDETPPKEDDPPADKTPPADGSGDEGAGKGDDSKPPAPDTTAKASAAFAAMRVENSGYKKMMQDIAGILGIQATDDSNALTTALQNKILEAQSKQQGVPMELLQKIQTLEQDNQLAKAERLQVAAYRGFQSVKDKFNLDNKKLQDFAASLQSNGINPFAQEIDLVAEYKLRNYDTLIEEAKALGAREEAERASKAGSHSTTPGKGQGQDGGEAGKINTVSDLTAWFSKQP